ncbi:TPA: hypothetical protein ACP4ZD_005188 [Klebsiella pneumoniae]
MSNKDIKKIDSEINKTAEKVIALLVQKEMKQGNFALGFNVNITFDIESSEMNVSVDSRVIDISEMLNDK